MATARLTICYNEKVIIHCLYIKSMNYSRLSTKFFNIRHQVIKRKMLLRIESYVGPIERSNAF